MALVAFTFAFVVTMGHRNARGAFTLAGSDTGASRSCNILVTDGVTCLIGGTVCSRPYWIPVAINLALTSAGCAVTLSILNTLNAVRVAGSETT
jgi:hypothetical protein